ncbi:MAG: hypothetical protein WDO73_02195 [Ignavibacteriota bacterium]
MLSNLIRFAGEEPCVVPPPIDFNNPAAMPPAPTPAAQNPQESFWQRIRKRFQSQKATK